MIIFIATLKSTRVPKYTSIQNSLILTQGVYINISSNNIKICVVHSLQTFNMHKQSLDTIEISARFPCNRHPALLEKN